MTIALDEFDQAFRKVAAHFGLTVKQAHFARQMARDQQARKVYLQIARSL